MTIAEGCILVAVLLPYAWVIVAKAIGRREGKFHNARPREYLGGATGMAARANWAHLNAFEAFAPFAAAVLIAEKAGVAQERVDLLAIVFVAARVLHGVCYLADRSTLRSTVWAVGFLSVIALFVSAALV